MIFLRILINTFPISLSKVPKLLLFLFLNLLILPLKFWEYIIYQKKVTKHQIEHSPIFIIGHWRSGTTYLHQLLSKDQDKIYLNFYKATFPSFFLSSESFLKPVLQRMVDLCQINIPYFNKIPYDWNFPCEEDTALLNMNKDSSAYWAYLFPNKAEEWFSKTMFYNSSGKEEEKWKKDYLFLLKKLSFKNKGKQMILKSPPNTSRIEQLLELFPDAKFIYIHRKPSEVFYSHLNLWKQNNNYFGMQNISDTKIELIITNTFRRMTEKYEKDKYRIKAKNLCEIEYNDLMKNPLEQIMYIYEKLELANYKKSEDHFEKYLSQHKYQPFSYNYDPKKSNTINKMIKISTTCHNFTT